MARAQKRSTATGKNYAKSTTPVAQNTHILKVVLTLPLWLFLYLIVKIGSFPGWLINKFYSLLSALSQTLSRALVNTILTLLLIIQPRDRQKSYKKLLKLRKKGIQLPDLSKMGLKVLYFFNLKKHPGRPRTQPALKFYRHKIGHFFNRLVPRKWRFRLTVAFLTLGLIFYSFLFSQFLSQLPSPHQLSSVDRPLTTEIYDRNGELLYQFYEGRNRELVPLQEIPAQMIQATVAIEDQHFFNHPGVDPLGIIRAAYTDLTTGKEEGGSTITQQLIKNTLLTSDKTFTRKIKEAILAFWAERIYSKDDILQMYFNEVPYGGPAWGVEAASEMYFGKKVADLDLAESSFLAGLPASPTLYSPYGTHPELGKTRQEKVLKRMVEDHYITEKQASQAAEEKLAFRPPTTDIKAPHFVMYVRSLLAQKYGERTVAEGGLKVTTTLDLGMQEMAENVVAQQIADLSKLNVGNGAAMITDAKTGDILAMVGSKDYFSPDGGNYNATLALRQPGSSIKVVTYATAFKQGYSPGTILLDTPTSFPNAWGQNYTPVNYDGRFHGAVTIRTALGSSFNIPAVKMLAMVGIPNMLATAHDMGITTFTQPDKYGLSLTLGGAAVRMIDMMSVYGTLASGGVQYTPQAILKVTDSDGNVLEDNTNPEGHQVLTPEVAYLLSNILSDDNARTPAFGPKSLLYIPDRTVAVKTGTSDDKRDNWAFGFTPEYVVGTWVGNNDYSPMDQALSSGITGATPIWHDLMVNILRSRPNLAFKKPSGIIDGVVDGHKDLVISGQTPKTVVGYQRVKQTDENGQKDAITYTDPFSFFTPDSTKTTQ